MQKSDKVRDAILKTFHYRDIFDYPLTFYQTYNYLISPEKIDFDVFKEAFLKLQEEGVLVKDGNFFHLGGSRSAQRRLKREQYSKSLEKVALEVARGLSKIPFLKLICITGAVAAQNAPKEDDVDILLVTGRNRLWITRLLVVLFLKARGLYRSDAHNSGRICPNIYITEDNLSWSHSKSVYSAHELLLMKPIYDKGGCYFKFLGANLWFKEFLPHLVVAEAETVQSASSNFFLDSVEKILMNLQLWYMKNKMTSEIATDKLIHFKKHDHSGKILQSFESKTSVE